MREDQSLRNNQSPSTDIWTSGVWRGARVSMEGLDRDEMDHRSLQNVTMRM